MTRLSIPRPRAAARRRTRVTAVVIAATLLLAGCASGAPSGQSSGEASGPETAAVATCAAPALPDGPIDAADQTGPATACTAESDLHSPAPATPAMPVTVTDAQGTEVTVASADRILALDLSGTLASTVFALGLGDRVVGRDVSTGFAEASDLPLVTQNGHQLNAEAILALDPTVILTDSSIGPWDVVLQMREVGIPVVVMPSKRSIGTIGELVTDVAAALGVPAEGERLAAEAEAAVEASTARLHEVADGADAPPRMMFLYVRGQANVYYVFGEESGADELIHALGGIDAAAEAGITGMRPLTAEAIVTAAPDLVLLMSKGLESVGGVDGLLDAVPALAQTPAGEQRRFVDMADHEILSFGPDYAAVIDALGAAVYAPGVGVSGAASAEGDAASGSAAPDATPAPAATGAAR
ncbi:heme/hemin ABC transporter substrate-binding protein [Agromyces aerolatus]|uniref:heme/hemin ABC transporter substrate-binding protein n=1 Tax=Agromyces sp. LY-1074 TaxID=3074080 RepID=UPI002858BB7B|nr:MULTISPECIES: ABC transporter substrate-binding protein [unclassified Agromyces]MDR5698729.1 ABC transporter substrate-binding protein [Agromyces sp. LY-1074]MDR5705023.1 ABC transporter substrate-binding protein [Agromyces sp. LY-1358]